MGTIDRSVVAVLCAGALTLSACGGGDDDDDSTASSSATADAAPDTAWNEMFEQMLTTVQFT